MSIAKTSFWGIGDNKYPNGFLFFLRTTANGGFSIRCVYVTMGVLAKAQNTPPPPPGSLSNGLPRRRTSTKHTQTHSIRSTNRQTSSTFLVPPALPPALRSTGVAGPGEAKAVLLWSRQQLWLCHIESNALQLLDPRALDVLSPLDLPHTAPLLAATGSRDRLVFLRRGPGAHSMSLEYFAPGEPAQEFVLEHRPSLLPKTVPGTYACVGALNVSCKHPFTLEGLCLALGPRDALEGNGPQRPPQMRLDRRLEKVAKAVGGGYCRL